MEADQAQEAVTPYVTDAVTALVTPVTEIGESSTNPWPAIQKAWCDGESSKSLAAKFGVTESAVRMRAQRGKWAKGLAKAVKEGSAKAVNRVVRQHVALIKPEIQRQASAAVRECIRETMDGAKEFVTDARSRLKGASNRDVSSIATQFRTGVDKWREALGLGSVGEPGSGGVTIACHSVHLGIEEREQIAESPAVDV